MRHLLTVFLASPSDLKPEREFAREVVNTLNASIREINWFVELLGWEDTLPGSGRPQSLINSDIEQCQLFIGLLWRHWGTPPDVSGEYTSGFEEEFQLARRLQQTDGIPQIWMFFKQVEPEQLRDPGTQLQRVQRFREEIVQQRTCLFKEFADSQEWKQQLAELLLRHVLRLHNVQESPPEAVRAQPQSPAPNATIHSGAIAAPAAGQQIEAFARALAPCFRTGHLRDVETSEFVNMSLFVARTWLLAHGASKVADGSYRPIATHELNTLYRYRRRLQATDTEKDVLFETMIADESTVAPGWYWVDTISLENIQSVLFRTLVTVDNDKVKKNTLKMLRFTDGRELTNERRMFLQEIVRYTDDLQKSVWVFLVEAATADDVDVIKRHASGTWLEGRLNWLTEWVSCGRDLESFLAHDNEPALFPFEFHDQLVAAISGLSTIAIERLTVLRSKRLLGAAIAELTRRGVQVSDEIRVAAISRESLLDRFIRAEPQKRELSDSDEAWYVRLSSTSSEALAQSLKWIDLESAVAYQILVERGYIDRETARADIASGFQRLHDRFINPFLQLASTDERAGEEVHKVVASLETHREFLAANFSEKAPKGLALDPTQEDAAVARRMLSESNNRCAAIRILAEVGGSEDVELLTKAAETSFGAERLEALAALRRAVNDDRQAFSTLISSTSIDLKRFAAWLLSDIPEDAAWQMAVSLPVHPDEGVRLGAVVYLGERLPSAALEQMLEEYLDRESYYYNVVTWFDRYLYAPKAALRAYSEQVPNPWHTDG